MWSDSPGDRALLDDLAREVVGEVAPEELDLFDQLADEYHANPAPPDLTQPAGDDALGFGLGGALIAATPAVAAAASVVLGLVMQIGFAIVSDEASDQVRQRLRALLRRDRTAPTAAPTLDREQLRQIRQAALNEALRFGMAQDEAGRIADALLRRLALGE